MRYKVLKQGEYYVDSITMDEVNSITVSRVSDIEVAEEAPYTEGECDFHGKMILHEKIRYYALGPEKKSPEYTSYVMILPYTTKINWALNLKGMTRAVSEI